MRGCQSARQADRGVLCNWMQRENVFGDLVGVSGKKLLSQRDLHFWGLCILSDRRLLQISWPRPRLASVEALHDLFCEAAVNKHSRLTQCSVKECCWIPPAVQQYNEMKQGTEHHDT